MDEEPLTSEERHELILDLLEAIEVLEGESEQGLTLTTRLWEQVMRMARLPEEGGSDTT